MGVVTPRWLMAKFKYAILIIFIIAAVITPTPDVATQCVFAFPDDRAVPARRRRGLDFPEAGRWLNLLTVVSGSVGIRLET